jgi:predicted Zn-ribbon and HTH transcriptional regulator
MKGGDIVKCKCKRCGYQWESMSDTDKPRVCPACKSYRWDMERMKGGRKSK